MIPAVNNHHLQNLAAAEDVTYAEQGHLYYDSGNYIRAWTCFNEAIKINPREWHHYYMRAACSANIGNFQAAFTDYNTAISLAKNNEDKGWCHFDMAVLCSIAGDEPTAMYHLKTAARFGHGIAQDYCRQHGIPF